MREYTGVAMHFISRIGLNDDRQHALYNKISRRLLPFLLVLYVVAFLDRVNVSFAKLSMSQAIGLSDAAYGFGAGVFFIGFCLFEIPSNMLLHRIGARIWIARIMVSWGLLTVLTAGVSSPWQFYLSRFILGIFEAGFYPGIILYLSYWYPRRVRGQATAIFIVGIALAGVIGSPLCGLIMSSMIDVGPLANWQWLFVLTGLPAVALGVATYFYLDERPETARWLTADEKQLIAADLRGEAVELAEAGAGRHFGDALSDWRLWCLGGTNFTILVSLYGVTFWLPQIVRNLGVANAFWTGLIVAVPSLLAAISMIVVARHSDRTAERRWHTVACALVASAGLVLAAGTIDIPVLALVGLSLAMIGVLTGFTILWTIPGLLVSGTAAAAGIALITTVGNFGGYVGPFLVGWVKGISGGFAIPLYVFAGFALFGASIVALIPGISRSRTIGADRASRVEHVLED